MKEYREANFDKIKEYKQVYYLENKEKIKENMKTITCKICNGKFLQCGLSRHNETTKHLIATSRLDRKNKLNLVKK